MLRYLAILAVMTFAVPAFAQEAGGAGGTVEEAAGGAGGMAVAGVAGAGGVAVAEVAGEAPVLPDPDENMSAFLAQVFAEVMSGDWVGLVALVLIGVVWGVRKYLAKWWPFLATDAGGALLVLVTSILGAAANAIAANHAVSGAILLVGLKVGFTAAGGFATVKKILKWLLPIIFTKVPFLAKLFGKAG